MQTSIALRNEGGDPAQCALRITRSPEGRIQVCKITEAGKPMGASADVSKDAMSRLLQLGFGQTVWLPTAEEPQFRITGEGKMVEIRENRASAEPLFVSVEDLQGVLSQIEAA